MLFKVKLEILPTRIKPQFLFARNIKIDTFKLETPEKLCIGAVLLLRVVTENIEFEKVSLRHLDSTTTLRILIDFENAIRLQVVTSFLIQ